MSGADRSDEELMRLFQQGDANAFEQLYRRYRTPVFSFLARHLGDRAQAEELCQEAFHRVVRSAGGFHHQSRFSTWIFTIARNLTVDAARRAKHRQHPSLDRPAGEDDRPLVERLPSPAAGPDRAAIARGLQDRLARAVELLPEDQREVFLLREYEGMPFHEIAEVVGTHVGTVKSRMRYALALLRRELADYEEYARSLP